MPSAYVKKLAKKHGVSTKTAEKKWDEAKKQAKKADTDDFYAYTTQVFKNMMGEKSSVMTVLQEQPLLACYRHVTRRMEVAVSGPAGHAIGRKYALDRLRKSPDASKYKALKEKLSKETDPKKREQLEEQVDNLIYKHWPERK